MVKVDIEYCGYCDFQSECENLAKLIRLFGPDTDVKCHRGRKGAFEVKVDEAVVFSRLKTEQPLNLDNIAKLVQDAFHEPETNSRGSCVLM